MCQVQINRQSMAAACPLFYKEEGMFIVAWLYCSGNMKEERSPARVLAFLTGPFQFVVLICNKLQFCEMWRY